MWVEAIFLNIPLQLVLALAALLMKDASTPGVRTAGDAAAVITTVLIVVHLAVSAVMVFMP